MSSLLFNKLSRFVIALCWAIIQSLCSLLTQNLAERWPGESLQGTHVPCSAAPVSAHLPCAGTEPQVGRPFSPAPWPPPLRGSAPSLYEPLLPVPVRGCRVAFLAVQSSGCLRDVFSGQVSCCPDLPYGSKVSEGHLSATLWPRGGASAPWHLQGPRSRADGGPRPRVRAVELPEVGQHPTGPLETGGGSASWTLATLQVQEGQEGRGSSGTQAVRGWLQCGPRPPPRTVQQSGAPRLFVY